MSASWEERVAAFWASADDSDAERMLTLMRLLVSERPAEDPDALFEWASVHDFLGLETEAVPLYRAALDAGLSGDRRPQAVIHLASSLRNVGDPTSAIELLCDDPGDEATGLAGRAFLALALRDAGRPDDALRVALQALAPTLPRYARAVFSYAEQLGHAGSVTDEGPVVRMWTGVVRTEDRDVYAQYVERTGMAEYRTTPGNLDAWLLTRDLGDGRTEITTVSRWESLEAITRFAGAELDLAVYYPEDDRYLLERDERVRHYRQHS